MWDLQFWRTGKAARARIQMEGYVAEDPNGVHTYHLDASPRWIGSDFYVPVRSVTELLYCYIEWQAWAWHLIIDCNRSPVSREDLSWLIEQHPPRFDQTNNRFEVPWEADGHFHMYPSAYRKYYWYLEMQNAIIAMLPGTRSDLRLFSRDGGVWVEDHSGNLKYRMYGGHGLRIMRWDEAEEFRLALASQAKRNAAWSGAGSALLSLLFPGTREAVFIRYIGVAGLGAGMRYTYSTVQADKIASCLAISRERYRGRSESGFVMVAWRGLNDLTCIPELHTQDLTWDQIVQLEVKDQPWWN